MCPGPPPGTMQGAVPGLPPRALPWGSHLAADCAGDWGAHPLGLDVGRGPLLQLAQAELYVTPGSEGPRSHSGRAAVTAEMGGDRGSGRGWTSQQCLAGLQAAAR